MTSIKNEEEMTVRPVIVVRVDVTSSTLNAQRTTASNI